MVVERISTSGVYNKVRISINNLRADLDRIVQKSGAKVTYDSFDEIKVGDSLRKVIDFNTQLTMYDSFKSNSYVAKSKMETILNALEHVYDFADDLHRDFLVFSSTEQHNLQLRGAAKLGLNFMQSTLNTAIAGNYVMSGSHTTTQPVNDIIMPNITRDSSGNIDYLNGEVTSSYYVGDDFAHRVTLDKGFVLGYGVNAGNPAFAKIIAALHMVINGTNNDDIMARAQNMLIDAKEDLLLLNQRVKYDYATVEKYLGINEDTVAVMRTMQGNIDQENGVDIISLTHQFIMNETVLSAAQYMFVNMSKLSILNFLK